MLAVEYSAMSEDERAACSGSYAAFLGTPVMVSTLG
jgi:hypothetical protein